MARPQSRLSVEGDVVYQPRAVLVSKAVVACGLVLCVGLVLELLPGLERWRWFNPIPKDPESATSGLLDPLAQREGSAELDIVTKQRNELAQPEVVKLRAPSTSPLAGPKRSKEDSFVVPRIDAKEPPKPIEDPTRSLEPFYASLAQAAAKSPGAISRILYHGDSLVASDYVTGTLRRMLQAEFGDAGHGFVLMADAWPSYFHNDIERFASRGFKVSRVVGPYLKDGFYGLGGVSFKAPPGVRARFGTAKKGKYGRNVSLFQLLYLKQPHGGSITVNIDGQLHSVLDTESNDYDSGVLDIRVPDGEHQLEIVTKTKFTRTFGVVMERDGPGVVLDAIGIQGARIRFLDKQDDAHWARQLQLRSPNLIVYQFGANESGDGFAYSMEDYHRTMKAVIEQAREAVPKAGCLVLAAMDRARKKGDYMITVPIIPHIVREQEATAREIGCAFFNTYAAMGGRGSMAKWVRRGLGQADLTHPSGYGAQVLGNWIFQALMQGYNTYLERGGLVASEDARTLSDAGATKAE